MDGEGDKSSPKPEETGKISNIKQKYKCMQFNISYITFVIHLVCFSENSVYLRHHDVGVKVGARFISKFQHDHTEDLFTLI